MKTERKKTSRRQVKRRSNAAYHLMMFPGLFFLILFSYIPMVGILMAFQDFVPAKGLFGSDFVGLKHFIYMIHLPDIGKIIRNTLVIALGKILLGTVMAIAFSILLNEIRIKFLNLPHFLSWVVLASVVVNLFSLDGSVNQLLAGFGLDKINFLGSNQTFQGLIIGTDVWKEFGYSSVVYLAAITSIDPGLHEAAAIDGASWWKRVWNVTIPGMLPIILLMAAMNLTGILSAGFDQIYNLYSPIVYETGDVLDTYVYRIGLVGRILLLTANGVTKKMTGQKIF